MLAKERADFDIMHTEHPDNELEEKNSKVPIKNHGHVGKITL